MTGHTPGPWRIESDSDGLCIIIAGSAPSMDVAIGVMRRDARLIMLAPDLLAFASLVSAFTKDGEETPDHPDGYDMAGDDAVETLANCITVARRLTSQATQCPNPDLYDENGNLLVGR